MYSASYSRACSNIYWRILRSSWLYLRPDADLQERNGTSGGGQIPTLAFYVTKRKPEGILRSKTLMFMQRHSLRRRQHTYPRHSHPFHVMKQKADIRFGTLLFLPLMWLPFGYVLVPFDSFGLPFGFLGWFSRVHANSAVAGPRLCRAKNVYIYIYIYIYIYQSFMPAKGGPYKSP